MIIEHIKVDKNIPVPAKFIHINDGYPFSRMRIGNSFLFSKTYNRKEMKRACGVKRRYEIKYGGKYAVAKHNKGVRIWKIK